MSVKMTIEEIGYATALVERGVPEHLHEGLRRFLVDGILPGHFLRAVLENDLAQAFLRSDPESRAGLHSLVLFLHHDAPADAWGHTYNVRTWCQNHRRIEGSA
jgi:hypothetical protein